MFSFPRRPSQRPDFDGLVQVSAPSQQANPTITYPDVGFFDAAILSQNSFASGTTLPPVFSPGDCWGVGLTGTCRPGQVLIVASAQRRTEAAGLAAMAVVATFEASGLERALANGALPPGIFIVRPGELLRFGAPVRDGIVCYSTILGMTGVLSAGVPLNTAPTRSSIVRFYTRDPGPDVTELNYVRGSYAIDRSFVANAAAYPIDGVALPTNRTLRLPQGTRNVLVQFYNPTTLQRITTETGVFDVGWLPAACGQAANGGGQTAYLVHNQADDFDAAGRGELSPTHDCEAYEVPSWASGIYIAPSVALPSTNIACMIHCTE